jgi:hypothetical protein
MDFYYKYSLLTPAKVCIKLKCLITCSLPFLISIYYALQRLLFKEIVYFPIVLMARRGSAALPGRERVSILGPFRRTPHSGNARSKLKGNRTLAIR